MKTPDTPARHLERLRAHPPAGLPGAYAIEDRYLVSSGIVFGLTAALCCGVADFCARGSARAGGTFLTLFYIQIVAVLALLAVAVPLGLVRLAGLTPPLLLAAVGINLSILVGAGLLYRAFAVGTLALVSPIAASFAALTTALALVSGERPHAAQLAGIALTLIGVTLSSSLPGAGAGAESKKAAAHARSHGRWRPAPGLLEALASLVVFGVAYWALRYVVAALGGVSTAFLGKVGDLVALSVIGLVGTLIAHRAAAGTPGRSPGQLPWNALRVPPRPFWLFLVPTALLDTAANIAYNVGISQALTAVVSVLSSLFSAVTVLLAWIFLRERLGRWQWAGVVAIFGGIALVSL